MTENCPLCNADVGLLKANFVSYVISSKKTINQYLKGELTFDIWVTDIMRDLKHE